ncbi:hypothetical protein ACQR1I_17485 [Bradyrhizobium sp. HKCCYLS2038]
MIIDVTHRQELQLTMSDASVQARMMADVKIEIMVVAAART